MWKLTFSSVPIEPKSSKNASISRIKCAISRMRMRDTSGSFALLMRARYAPLSAVIAPLGSIVRKPGVKGRMTDQKQL